MFTKVIALAILAVAVSQAQHGHGGHSSGASYVSFDLGHGDLGGHSGGGGGLSLGGGGLSLGGGHGLGGNLGGGLGGHHGGYVLQAAPVAISQGHGHGHDEHYVDYHAHPKYEFKYGVSDGHTHDQHSQHEVRDGDTVHGEYSLHEPDGTIRIVKYTADKKNGFNAQVIRQGHAVHPETTHKGQFAHYGGGHGGHGGY